MIGPFTTAPGGFTHVLVAMTSLQNGSSTNQSQRSLLIEWLLFVCDILHCFGFPNTFITDLGSNFHSHEFWDFCERSSIEVKYVSVAHPRANG
jgi:hypothetical protein